MSLVAASLIGIGGCSDPKIEKQKAFLERQRSRNVIEVENQARGKTIESLKKAGIESGNNGDIKLIIVQEAGAKFNSTTKISVTSDIIGKMVFNNGSGGVFYEKVAKSDELFQKDKKELNKDTQFVFILPQSKQLTKKEISKLQSYFPNNQFVGDVDIRQRPDSFLEVVVTAVQVEEMMKKSELKKYL